MANLSDFCFFCFKRISKKKLRATPRHEHTPGNGNPLNYESGIPAYNTPVGRGCERGVFQRSGQFIINP